LIASRFLLLLGLTAAAASARWAPLETAAPAAACCTIPAETVVDIEVDQAVGSRESRTGDTFPIHLAADIVVDGRTLVPAGAPGIGEVVHAARRRLYSGSPGELILAARFVQSGDLRIPLHRLGFMRSGRDGPTYLIFGPGYASVAPGIGGNVEVPAGTRLKAKVAGDVHVPTPAG